MFIGVFPSFTFSGRSRSGVFCKVCFTYTYVWPFRGYSMLIRGFFQFRFQWSRSFLRHADKHISDHLGIFQYWYGFFPQFRFRCSNLRQVKVVSGVVSKPCWYARVWLVRGHAVLIRGFSQFRFDSIHCTFWMKRLRTLPTFLRKKKTKGNFPEEKKESETEQPWIAPPQLSPEMLEPK